MSTSVRMSVMVKRFEIAGATRRHHNNTLRAWESMPVARRTHWQSPSRCYLPGSDPLNAAMQE